MSGLLVPPWYHNEEPTRLSFALVSFLFGFSTACAAFTAVTILAQAHRTWKRSRMLVKHPYIAMIVTEWVSSVVISIISYLFILDVIPPSFWLFFGILCLWVLQIQCIMHMIVNRIALIMCDQRRVQKLKWLVTLLIGAINISVFIIWMPARLQINTDWVRINNVWDRVEKGILLFIDLGLNLYFIYLVRAELIGLGLKKYWNLYWFNVGMIFISISLDIILVGIMSLPTQSTFIYVQFHPLMYLIKLKIEMNMADLIIKIVRASSPPQGHALHRYAGSGLGDVPDPAPRTSLPARPYRSTSDTTTKTKNSTSGTSQTNIIAHEADSKSPLKYQHSPKLQQQQQKRDSADQGWELTRMPSNFDAGDVVRKMSVSEGNCVGMVPLAVLVRPPLMRNMSEMTALEIGAGYLNQDMRDKRTSGMVEQSPV